MKLPNGYGSIYRLKGNRRKPFAVTKTSYINGKRKTEYLGYFETKALAIKFLSDYNLTPKERQNIMTFSQLYDEWSAYKFPQVTQNTVNAYKTAYKRCFPLYECKLADIEQNALQSLIDNENSIGGARRNYYLIKSMFDYAERRDYIERNRVSFLDIPKQEKSDLHRRLTNGEIALLWANKDNPVVATFLCLIYTGCRPMELFCAEKHKDYIEIKKGKTENAVRQVPLHKDIIPLMKHLPEVYDKNTYTLWSRNLFLPCMTALDIKCTPYDARHTFATLWSELQLDEGMRCRIQGHSVKGMKEYYVHYDLEILRKEINKLPTSYIQKGLK